MRFQPENILLTDTLDDFDIKLTDFGLSRIVGEGSFMKTICGTPMVKSNQPCQSTSSIRFGRADSLYVCALPQYIAPEVLCNMMDPNATGYGKAVDLWSLGVVLYIL